MSASRIARDIHDDLGARLTHLQLLSDKTAIKHSQDSLEKHLHIINEKTALMSRSMDEIVWAADPKRDTLEDLIDYIAIYSEDYLRYSPIHCDLDLPIDVPVLHVDAATRHAIFSCVKESLNNALKHANCQTIFISATLDHVKIDKPKTDKTILYLNIRDDGSGFEINSKNLQSDGLENMTQHMTRIDGKCTIHSDTTGTTISLCAPLGTNKTKNR